MGLGVEIPKLNRSKVGRQLRQAAFHEDSPINAFDTETVTKEIAKSPDTNAKEPGKIYLLSRTYDNIEDYQQVIGNEDFSALDSDQIFTALISNQTRQPAVNVWYNLDFDANALIGTVLNEEQMTALADTNNCEIQYKGNSYEMTYVKGKFLSIKDENRHRSTHYDISQFFNTSLDNAAKSWLNKEKKDIDPTQAHTYPWKKVVKYAKKDSELTKELWEKFVLLGEKELNIPLGKPISTGFVAQNVVFDTLLEKTKWSNSQFQELARQAYHGGRFEVYRRGFFKNVIGLDINSAYPYHMSQMPDLGGCTINIGSYQAEDLRNADWGFVNCTVTTDKNRNIQPFAVKNKKVIFPALENYELTVTIDEFLFALDNGYIENYYINKAGLVYENPNVNRPFSFLSDWYEDRNNYKRQIQQKGDRYDKFQYILKVIMNSVYGKTCQITEKKEYLTKDQSYTPGNREFITEGYEGDMMKGWFEAGDLFNPFYASYITALTRKQLHEAVLSLDVEEETIMLATDCLMLDRKDISQKDIDNLIAPESLGGWDEEYTGSAFVVGSGVYDVYDNDIIQKMAMRGFKEVTKQYDSWRDAAIEANGEIVLENERPARFKEWLLHEAHPRPAEFFTDERTLTPNFDTKRKWQQEATFDSLLTSNHDSAALVIS